MIVDFKEKLLEKIKATYQKSTSDPSYTTFLKHFGEFTVAKLDKKEISGQEYILEELRAVRTTMNRLERTRLAGESDHERGYRASGRGRLDFCLREKSAEEIDKLLRSVLGHPVVKSVTVQPHHNHKHLLVQVRPGVNTEVARQDINGMLHFNSSRHQAGNGPPTAS